MLFSLLIPLLLGTAVLGQLPFQKCPLPFSQPAPRNPSQIILPNQLPYQAQIYLVWGNETYQAQSMWGAVLIHPQWLLTAESSLEFGRRRGFVSFDSFYKPIEVFLGCDKIPTPADKNRINPKMVCEAGVKRRVVRHFRGPRIQIRDRIQDSDLLLLELDEAVPTSANVKPIELPEVGTSWTNRTAVVSGFGELPGDDRQDPPRTLQYTKVPILSKRDCLEMFRKKLPVGVMSYQSVLYRKVAPETILCAEFEVGGHGSTYYGYCSGHSGGPLAVCATPLQTSGQLCEGNRWQLAGFFSTGFDDWDNQQNKCTYDDPALFTNVAPFADWIRRVIRNN